MYVNRIVRIWKNFMYLTKYCNFCAKRTLSIFLVVMFMCSFEQFAQMV